MDLREEPQGMGVSQRNNYKIQLLIQARNILVPLTSTELLRPRQESLRLRPMTEEG